MSQSTFQPLTPSQLKTLQQEGYLRIPSAYGAEDLAQLKVDSEAMIERFYTREELDNHSVYPSDSTETRVSHAFMISEGESEFPRVDHSDFPMISRFLSDYNRWLGDITDELVPAGARCMLNYQNYFSGSKPVAEHFDGEYLKTQRATDTVEFKLLEGILPRYVALLVVANENEGRGIELLDHNKGEIHRPKLNPGDLVVFDNINLRHRVPTLELPRTSIGIRSFDHLPLHFAATEAEFIDGDYTEIAEGWVSKNADANGRFRRFMKEEWPTLKAEYAHYF